MKTNVINISIVIGAVAVLVLLACFVKVGVTADSVAVLKTKGMSCGSCGNDISAALQRVNGVAITEVDVENGWVVVGYDAKQVKPETLAEKINSAGFVSVINQVLTPAQFKQLTGRDIGKSAASKSGCCGKGGCGTGKQS